MKTTTDGRDSLGKIDRNILRILQKDGRISYTELARQVGLSVTPCIDRVKRMERNGYILGYSAQVCSQKLDAALVVFVQIRLNHTSQKNFEEFRRSVIDLENMCKVAFWSLATMTIYSRQESRTWPPIVNYLGHRILKLPAVQESTSYVVMEELKETMEVPISY